MTDSTPNDPDDRDRNDDRSSDDERSTGPFGLDLGARIGTLLDMLEDAGRRRPRGPGSSDRIAVDSDISIGTGLGDRDRRRPGGPNRPRTSRDTDRSRTKRVRSSDDDYLTTVRREDGALVITADLPGVDRDDLSVGVTADRDRLVIGVDGDVIDRMSLSDADPDAIRATYNNHVLEVRVPASVDDGGPDP